jgi:hypothetical protein
MKKVLLLLCLVLSGCCTTTYEYLKPTKIYELEDGSKIRVYSTVNETIYVGKMDAVTPR